MFPTVGDITAPLCRGHRRAICVDGWYGQFYRCGESCQSYHQPKSNYFYDITQISSGLRDHFSMFTALFCVSASDRALYSLRVHLWRDAPESQYPDWKAGWRNRYGKVSCESAASTITFLSLSCIRTFVTAQRAGPHWARSRWSQLRSALPVKTPVRSRGWSANPHSSLVLTVPKASQSKSALYRTPRFLCPLL